jgi:hypothetical protein
VAVRSSISSDWTEYTDAAAAAATMTLCSLIHILPAVRQAGENCVADGDSEVSGKGLNGSLGIDPVSTSEHNDTPLNNFYQDSDGHILVARLRQHDSSLADHIDCGGSLSTKGRGRSRVGGLVYEHLKHQSRLFLHWATWLIEAEPVSFRRSWDRHQEIPYCRFGTRFLHSIWTPPSVSIALTV